jgi:hypothetical protein
MTEEPRTFPSRGIITTEKAAFHLTIRPLRSRKTNIIEEYKVGLGTRRKKQLFITVPTAESGKTKGSLMWIERTGPVCTFDPIKDSKSISQHTIQLAFTIARDINPNCLYYSFQDCSVFSCTLPGRVEKNVPTKIFHIAFYGGTWYEIHFGARIEKNHELYERLKAGRDDPSTKPADVEYYWYVNFMLYEILHPIYKTTKTWGEFLRAIEERFGDKKYAVVYPLIVSALTDMFYTINIFDEPNWYIDLSGNDKTPLIPFRCYEDIDAGNHTRKNKQDPFSFPPFFSRHIPQIQAMDYYTFLGIERQDSPYITICRNKT